MKLSYTPTSKQFKQVEGAHHDMNVIYPLRRQVAMLSDIEAEICRLINSPAQARTLVCDFAKRYNLNQKMHWVLKPGSRFVRLQKVVRVLKEVMDKQLLGKGPEIQFGLYAHALLNLVTQSEFQSFLQVKEGAEYQQETAEAHHERLNALLSKLERECKSPEFIRKVKAEKTEVDKRRISLQTWFRAVIRSAPRVLWIQVQLGYDNLGLCDNAAVAIQHRAEFLKGRRKAFEFKHMLGYVCKLSYLPARGYVHDLVVLYDADLVVLHDADYVFESESLAIALGMLWHRVTKGSGVAFIDGGPTEGTAASVNGLVSMNSADDRKKVKDMIEYLSQFDTYIHYHATDKSKTLVKSQAPGTRKKKKAVSAAATP